MVQPQSAESRLSENKAFQLADALGSANATLQKFNQEYEARKTEEQVRKIPAYVEQFKKDWDGGAVSQAQVRERFPETVPVIAARVAEAMGDRAGEEAIRGIMGKVMEDDSLKLDTEARATFIEEEKQRYIAEHGGKNNEFYSSGFLKAFDTMKNQYENQFMQQTAGYHQKVQEESFAKQVESVFVSGGNVEQLDDIWKTSSSIDNLTRKKVVVDTVTKLAFASDDPSMLDKIPTRFLNAESKKDIEATRNQIQNARITKFNSARAIEAYQREEAVRKDKQSIVESIVSGKTVDPAQFRNNPETFAFALNANNTSLIPEATSAANAEKIRNDILTNSTIGVTASHGEFVDAILLRNDLSPQDKKKLIDEVPKLIEGNIAMKDPMVATYVDSRIDPRLKSLENSTNARVQTLLSGRNLRAEVMRTFDSGIRTAFEAEYRDNGKWPTGKRKLEIIDLEVDKAERMIESLTKVDAVNNPAASAAPAPSNNSNNSAAPPGKKKVPVPGMPNVFIYQ
jgi:hypothetical protein